MKPIFTKILLSTLLLFSSLQAQATTYSNLSYPYHNISALGVWPPYLISMGETFLSPGGMLRDFTFYAASGEGANVSLTIASWDGGKAVGPALYVSAPIEYTGGDHAIGAKEINLKLIPNENYIAYLTPVGIINPLSQVIMKGSWSDGGLPGGYRIQYTPEGVDLLEFQRDWFRDQSRVPNMAYTANITFPVPEPETYAMLLAGLAFVGFAARRKAKLA